MRFLQTRAEELQKIIDEMGPDSSIAVLHDSDPDGICSGIMLDAYLKSQDKSIAWRTHPLAREKPFLPDFIRKIDEHKITHLFILDYNLEGYGWTEQFLKFKETHPNVKVCVIDHHAQSKDFPFDYHANTAFDQLQIPPDQYCTSKFIYDLLMIIWSDVQKLKRIASIGIIGDSNHFTWGLFIQECIKEENKQRAKLDLDDYRVPKDAEEYMGSPYGRISLAMFYGIAKHPKEVAYIFDTLKKNLPTNNILEHFEKYKDIEEEIDDYVDNFEYCMKNTDLKNQDVRVFELEIKSQHDILVITANLLSFRDKETVFFIYERQGDSYMISARLNSNKINLGDIMKSVSSKVPGSNGGGHVPAAGAKVPKAEFDKFKELFYNEIGKVKL